MVSSIVITLEGDEQRQRSTVESLRREARMDLGEPIGHLLPAVVESAGRRDLLEHWERLLDLEGVALVELACVHYEEAPA